MTGSADAQREAEKHQASGYLGKPFKLGDLLAAVDRTALVA